MIDRSLNEAMVRAAEAENAYSRFWSKVDRHGPDECWPWTGDKDREGYGRMKIAGKKMRAIRFACFLDGRGPRNNEIVRHSCDNPACANPAHLLLGTAKQNANDRVQRGRRAHIGGRPKLNIDAVNEIRASNEKRSALAARFGVSLWSISAIKSYRSWPIRNQDQAPLPRPADR